MRVCSVDGCANKHYGKGLCRKHYYQVKIYGKVLKRTKFDKNEIRVSGNIAEIDLYNANHECFGEFALLNRIEGGEK